MIATRTARWAITLTTTAIVLGATASGAAASNGPGRSGDAHAEHGHPNPDAVRGHDEEGKRGKGHESHGNGHGYGHGEIVVIIDEPVVNQPVIERPTVESPNQTPNETPNQTPGQTPNESPNQVVVGNPVAQVLPSDSPEVPGVATDPNVNDPVEDLPASTSDNVTVDEPAVTAANVVETRARIVASVGDVEIGAAGGFAGVILRHC